MRKKNPTLKEFLSRLTMSQLEVLRYLSKHRFGTARDMVKDMEEHPEDWEYFIKNSRESAIRKFIKKLVKDDVLN